MQTMEIKQTGMNEREQDVNSPEEFYNLHEDDQYVLVAWIKELLDPHKRRTYNPHLSSYKLKHQFEQSNSGFYVNNGAFKGAMQVAGYIPRDEGELNWRYTLSTRAGGKRDMQVPIV